MTATVFLAAGPGLVCLLGQDDTGGRRAGQEQGDRYEAAAMIQVGGGGGSHQGAAVGRVKGVGFCFEKSQGCAEGSDEDTGERDLRT